MSGQDSGRGTDESRTEILNAHEGVRGQLAKLEQYLQQPIALDGQLIINLSEMLHKLVETLRSHFDQEESAGMHVELRVRFPRLASRFERVMSEHPRILNTLEDLLGDLRVEETVDSQKLRSVRERVQQAVEMLHEHERAETTIIMDAYWEDLGDGD